MDPRAVLAAFDEQVRRDETAEPGDRVESDDSVLRVVSDVGGWSGVAWTALDTTTADAVIAAEVERFAGTGVEWEWKYYSYDRPDDLAQRLVAAGLRPDPEESLMVAEIADLDVSVALPDGVHLRPVTDAPSAAALVAAAEEAFDEQYEGLGERLLAADGQPPVERCCGRRDGGRTADRLRPDQAAGHRRLRQPVGRRDGAGLATTWRLPCPCCPSRRDRPGPRLPLPPGRRRGGQPADPAATRLRRACEDHSLSDAQPAGLTPLPSRRWQAAA